MAKTPKVRLYIRIRRFNGTDAFVDPAWNRKRTLREGYALIEGELEHHPEGVYYLRFLRNGKRVWERIGQDADVAVVALRNTEHDLQSMALGRSAPVPVVSPQTSVSPNLSVPAPVAALKAGFSPGSVSLKDAIDSYLKEIRRSRSPKTIAACEHMLNFFESRLPGKLVKSVTREDLLDHKAALKEKGLGDRTIYNHIMRIGTLVSPPKSSRRNLLGWN